MSIRTRNLYASEIINARKLLELEIKERTFANKLVEKIIDVVKNFDGKVLNIKFRTALQEKVDSNIYVMSDYNIKYNFHQRYVIEHKEKEQDYACAIYVRRDNVYLTNLFDTKVLDENNRIIAQAYIDNLLKEKQEHETQIAILKKRIKELEKIDSKYCELITKTRNYIDSIDYLTKEYLQINQLF